MNMPAATAMHDDSAWSDAIDAATARIAPSWPLDRAIAVNPLWGHIGDDVQTVDARLRTLVGTRFVMPAAYYAERWHCGDISERDLAHALDHAPTFISHGEALAWLTHPEPVCQPLPLVSDFADAAVDATRGWTWREFIVQLISERCAQHFDAGQSGLGQEPGVGLYSAWRESAAHDLRPRLAMGMRCCGKATAILPSNARDAITAVLGALDVGAANVVDYLTALLLSVNGWASWCAFLRWEARLAGREDDSLVDLLAIRLAWEFLLARHLGMDTACSRLRTAWADLPVRNAHHAAAAQTAWVWHSALEHAYRNQVGAVLRARGASPRAQAGDAKPIEAVFCIDVRSEVMRRALEGLAPDIATRGFAGFFGLPLEFAPIGAHRTEARLPGLLSPTLKAREVHDDVGETWRVTRARQHALRETRAMQSFEKHPLAAFSFVEGGGLGYLLSLLGRGSDSAGEAPGSRKGISTEAGAHLRVRFAGVNDIDRLAASAAAVLKAMGLPGPHVRLVLLCGHGADTANNPQAAALACGACGGHAGDVNARLLVSTLNDPAIRRKLARDGLELAPETHFVAGLHDTVSDRVTLLDGDLVPASHATELERLAQMLGDASRVARIERAKRLGLDVAVTESPERLEAALAWRGRDWAQVRPEWGLAGCAAFVVAPRSRTRGVNLQGRVFLHDYDWKSDAEYKVLELILTAPMVVTHWINMQYYASTVCPNLYGSGNKTLHNVVGATLGVLEGNGGDLRIGLPLQSVHNGDRPVHVPLRLNVYIEAPQCPLDYLLARHPVLGALVGKGWLHMLRIDSETGEIYRRTADGWEAALAS